ncbi:MAG TPA: glutamate--tRNA ligase [Pusillimonas sp.]|uniref:glutamate--tRNA ligase n=1 Tax=Pusillimonas sp. TaxID=3040095 RepID=UPI002C4589B9|nr:glutamate--tRNA ligase [Pusillimonas sp.]HUH88937.1 glutamate--tRNA ligase [Pusillimonas sp.]
MSSSIPPVVRTRFAPSPTGYLHLGGARTALFSWAFARHHKGVFILRIEDTDLERSTPEAVQAILDGMQWLQMQPDEGPFYQMQRMDRYREVVDQLLEQGSAYLCYSSPQEVEAMREKARAAGLKPRYDGTWRPEPGKTLPPVPADRKPVVRFRNPTDGSTGWNDVVKGPISFDNTELDDLVIARPDGTPTYNFCVVVDDWDMKITHVLRGDDHINNTPRQINILRALGAEPPAYGHLPMILGPDGDKLSKRHGAVSVMEYDKQGYLPEAMVNYLARLGWSHGDDELFDRDQLIEWFDGRSLSKSAAQWDPKKLNWVNAHYIKQSSDQDLAELVAPRIAELGANPQAVPLEPIMALLKDRAETLNQLAEGALLFYAPPVAIDPELATQHLTPEAKEILRDFTQGAKVLEQWNTESLAALIQETLAKHNIKMPKLGIPLRLATTGRKQTPAIDAVLAILGRDVVLQRLESVQDA